MPPLSAQNSAGLSSQYEKYAKSMVADLSSPSALGSSELTTSFTLRALEAGTRTRTVVTG